MSKIINNSWISSADFLKSKEPLFSVTKTNEMITNEQEMLHPSGDHHIKRRGVTQAAHPKPGPPFEDILRIHISPCTPGALNWMVLFNLPSSHCHLFPLLHTCWTVFTGLYFPGPVKCILLRPEFPLGH